MQWLKKLFNLDRIAALQMQLTEQKAHYEAQLAELQPAKELRDKGYLLHDKYEIVPAFEWNGETYFMHKDPLNTATGRGLTAMVFQEELIMRCDINYLRDYCKAIRVIFSDPKKIDILQLATITRHLEERIDLLAAVPSHVYKMASVVFFTENESAFKYDLAAGQERIKQWQATPGMYDFFLQTPLRILVPSLALPEANSQAYLAVLEKIDEMHFKEVRRVLSSSLSADVPMN